MSNHPFLKEALATHKAKMAKEGVSGEGDRAKAKRIAYAEGGGVEPQPKDLYSPSDLARLSRGDNMGASTPNIGDKMNADTSKSTPLVLKGKTPR